MNTLLFSTPHGSHLYGTSHADSDNDIFDVYENKIGRIKARYAKQTIKDKYDVTKTDLSTFVLYAAKGVPQYLEAMYSRMDTFDGLGREYRFNFKPNRYEAEHTYNRTLKAFYERGVEEDNDKFKRHAWRLYLNREHIVRGEYFNPTLSYSELLEIESKLNERPYAEDDES